MSARILVVEDNAANLELMTYLLRAHGHTPTGATDGTSGLQAALEGDYQLVLTDILMPHMDGYALLERLRASPRLAATKIVAVTALAMVGDRERILSAGFDGYLAKPIVPEKFVREIEAFLPSVPTILILDDEPNNRSLLSTLLASRGYVSIEASTGPDALRLARKHRPDLTIVDLRLSGMDGPEFVRTLRADPQIAGLRLALYTGSSRSAVLDDFLATAGIEYVIPKPGDPEEVLRIIDRALSGA
jgi:CheY-like chemotaxis protein